MDNWAIKLLLAIYVFCIYKVGGYLFYPNTYLINTNWLISIRYKL